MMNDGYGDLGKVMGFTAARFVEKKWVRFRPLKKGLQSLLLCLAGLIPVVLLKGLVRPILTGALGNHWGKLIFSVIHVLWFITLYPPDPQTAGQGDAAGPAGSAEKLKACGRGCRRGSPFSALQPIPAPGAAASFPKDHF